MKARSTVKVTGRVQGVGFRQHTARAAAGLGLTGFVRNLPDGSVEALFEGEEADIGQMTAWCRRGPGPAQVAEVSESRGAYTGEFADFSIRYRDEE